MGTRPNADMTRSSGFGLMDLSSTAANRPIPRGWTRSRARAVHRVTGPRKAISMGGSGAPPVQPDVLRQARAPASIVSVSSVTTRQLVPFHGEGSGEGELTWGQQGIWLTMARTGRTMNIGGAMPVEPGTSLEDLKAV